MRFPGLPRLPVSRRRLTAHRDYLARRVEDLRISLSEVEQQRDELLDDVDRSCAWAMNVMSERDEAQARVAELEQAIREVTCVHHTGHPDDPGCGKCRVCQAQAVLDGHDRQQADTQAERRSPWPWQVRHPRGFTLPVDGIPPPAREDDDSPNRIPPRRRNPKGGRR